MSSDSQTKARKLAARPYDVEVLCDETTDGQPIYLARNPELPGCMAQGETIEEAVVNLADARIDYIESLLEDKLPVPDPASIATQTGSMAEATIVIVFAAVSTREPAHQERLYEASLKTMRS